MYGWRSTASTPVAGEGGLSGASTVRICRGASLASTTGIASACLSASRRARRAAFLRRPDSSVTGFGFFDGMAGFCCWSLLTSPPRIERTCPATPAAR